MLFLTIERFVDREGQMTNKSGEFSDFDTAEIDRALWGIEKIIEGEEKGKNDAVPESAVVEVLRESTADQMRREIIELCFRLEDKIRERREKLLELLEQIEINKKKAEHSRNEALKKASYLPAEDWIRVVEQIHRIYGHTILQLDERKLRLLNESLTISAEILAGPFLKVLDKLK